MPYAKGTTVPRDRTLGEIERTLARYGAQAFAYGWQGDRAVVAFQAEGRNVRFEIPMPPREEFRFTPGRGYERSAQDIQRLWEQAQRERWRALLLVVKAKLEAVEAGIAEFEEEFLAYIVLPGGDRVGDRARPEIAAAYERGSAGPMLPGLGGSSG